MSRRREEPEFWRTARRSPKGTLISADLRRSEGGGWMRACGSYQGVGSSAQYVGSSVRLARGQIPGQ